MPRKRSRANGEGSIYRRKDGRWEARVTIGIVPRQRRLSVYGKTRKEAADALQALQARIAAGQPMPAGQIKVGEWLDQWLARHVSTLRAKTRTSYRQVARDYIRPGLGRARLLTLSVQEVELWLDDLLNKGTPAPTAAYSLNLLRACLKDAMRADLIVRNPAALVRPPRWEPREAQPFTDPEARLFMEKIKEHRLYPLIVLALTSGLRRGELLGLTWDAVKLDERTMWVRQQVQRETGRGLVLNPVKTKRSKAPVALTALAVRGLQAQRGRLAEERMRSANLWQGSDNPVAPDAFVFVSTTGTKLDPDNVYRSFRAMLVTADLPHRRLHDSRSTTASLLDALGVPPSVIAAVLRHSRVATTLNSYTKADLRRQMEAADKLDELLGGVLA